MTVRASLLFDSHSDFLDGPVLSGLGSEWTVEVRLMPIGTQPSVDGTTYILDTDAGGDVTFGAFQLLINPLSAGGPALVHLHSNNQGSVTSECPIDTGRATMISVTKDAAGLVRIYANGTRIGEGTLAVSINFPTALRVGRAKYNHVNSPAFSGKIEALRFWTAVRSQTAIQGDYAGDPSTSLNLYRNWQMEEGSGSTITDTVAAATMSVTGATWASDDWSPTAYDPCFDEDQPSEDGSFITGGGEVAGCDAILYIGPVAVRVGNHSASWTGQSDQHGIRPAQFNGVVDDPAVSRQIQELVANPHRRVTIGAFSGVLEPVWGTGDYREFSGWYLLQAWRLEEGVQNTDANLGWSPFSLDGAFLGGQRRPVIVRGARDRGSDFSPVPSSLVANPLWDDNPAAGRFIRPPGGPMRRYYDPVVPSDLARTASDGRWMRLFYFDWYDDFDPMAPAALPRVPASTAEVPEWVVYRGGDVRAYDRRSGREVYGPSHHFLESTDIVIDNGILRLWIGPRGHPPIITVEAFAEDDQWHHVGYATFEEQGLAADDTLLVGAQVIKLTPDVAVVELDIEEASMVSVTLRRGERMLRVVHGRPRPPRISLPRYAQWTGIPPYITAAIEE